MKKVIETIRAGRHEAEVFKSHEEARKAGYGYAFSENGMDIFTKYDDESRPYHADFAVVF